MSDPGLSFNSIASEYNKNRPAYPLEFVNSVLSVLPKSAPARFLEIGCGTGQATIRLAELGHTVVCVEPGEELLAIARDELKSYQNVSFIHSKFELADLEPASFDVVFAANSLHWVDAEERFRRPFEALKPAGYLIAVWRWNLPLEGALGHRINALLAKSAPEMKIERREDYERGALDYFREMIASNLYWSCQVCRSPYGWQKPAADYARWIGTWSQLAALPAKQRIKLCQDVEDEILSAGGSIHETGETVIISGQKPH